MHKKLLQSSFDDLQSAGKLLKESLELYEPFDLAKEYSANELERYDAFSFRYQKAIEAAMYFFRVLERFEYAQESSTLRDRLLIMEKLALIDGIDQWMEARNHRNKIAHVYEREALTGLYKKTVQYAQMILATVPSCEKYVNRT